MLFTSRSFVLFFGAVFVVYYFLFKEKTKAQNWLLLLSSYFFYGYANWKIVPILLTGTIVFYALGIAIRTTKNEKRASWLTTSGVLLGIGLLVYFKYFNFFIDSFSSVLNAIGLKSNIGTLNIIMPLGISFFTFKLISYVVEIYRGKIEPCKDFVAFSTYIAFFPTILSGPIDRPNTFLPQLKTKRPFNFELATDGSRQILWGLFQKVVIADNLAPFINTVWNDIPGQSASTLFIVAILYSIQLYTDFSGYSHMAIGIGKMLGFRITINFNYPFFSRNIAEYWRNWHMSLTSWLTDYIFMPLNIKFRNLGKLGLILAIMINMLAIGMWHGANWTFAVFGLYHGLLFIPLVFAGSIFKKKKLKTNKLGLATFSDYANIILTFLLVTLGLVFFKANSIGQAWEYLAGICDLSLFSLPVGMVTIAAPILFSLLFFTVEWFTRENEYALEAIGVKWKKPVRFALYYAMIIAIIWYQGGEQQFIYFQF